VLAKSARTAQPGLRVVVMSGGGEFEAGLDGELLKPFTDEQLLHVVEHAFRADATTGTPLR